MRINDKPMKSIKVLIILLLCSVSCVGQCNKRDNIVKEKVNIIGHWRVDEVIGLELINKNLRIDEYVVQERLKANYRSGNYFGWRVEFKNDMSFTSRYSSGDGLDFFADVTGSYGWIDDNHIKIHVKKIIFRSGAFGGRKSVDEEPNIDLGVYIVVKTDNGFNLVKCAPDETDEQRISYSDMLHKLPKIYAGSSGLSWLKLDPYNRDTDYLKILQKGLAAGGRYDPAKAKLVFSRRINVEVLAFIFRYEGKSISAFYSAGPEQFAVMDYIIPQYLDIIEAKEEYVTYLIRLEKDEREKEAKLPKKKDKHEDIFLRCEIVINYYDAKKGSKREIFTLHYLFEEFYNPKIKAYTFRYDINCRMELSQLLKNGEVVLNQSVDKNSWKSAGEITGSSEIKEESIYMKILHYYWGNTDKIPVLRDR